jgi:hypothetical protein
MNTYDKDTKCCNSNNVPIPNPNTIYEVIQENSYLINEIAVDVDRLQHNLFGVGGSLNNTEFINDVTCLYDEVTTQNSELKSIIEILNFIKDRLLG